MKKNDVSIIVPAFNEAGNLEQALGDIKRVLRNFTSGYEVIVVNDGSTDGTKKIAEEFARRDSRIRVINHRQNRGFGETFKNGLAHAKKTYVASFHGDNDASARSFRTLIDMREEADLVISYTRNPQKRNIGRRAISRLYVVLLNVIFRLNLRYFNGLFICRTELLRSVPLKSEGLAIYSEAKIRLLKKGASFKEVPFEHTGRKFGKSKAVTLKSFIDTFQTVWNLVKDIYLVKRRAKSPPSPRLRRAGEKRKA